MESACSENDQQHEEGGRHKMHVLVELIEHFWIVCNKYFARPPNNVHPESNPDAVATDFPRIRLSLLQKDFPVAQFDACF